MKYAGPRLAFTLAQGGRTSSGGREQHRARSALVIAQVALALVLLAGSGLMIRTIFALKQVQPGFTDPARILTLRLSIPGAQVKDAGVVARIEREIIDKVAAIPGAASVSLTTGARLNGDGWHDPIWAENRVYAEGQIPPLRFYRMVAPGSFQTMGNPLLAGRDLTWTDIHEVRPVVLVSENLARELWGSPAAALGKRVHESPKGVWREVIGVVGNTHDDGVSAPATSVVYWPLLLRALWGSELRVERNPTLIVRSARAGSAAFFNEVQQAIWSVNPNLTIANVRTMQEIYDRSLERTSFTLVMLTVAAAMALLLGIVGIYGVISYAVSQRTREIGVRIALGAQQSSVRGIFVWHALALTGVGVTIGMSAAVGLTRLMSALLYGVKPVDPETFGLVVMLLVAAALAAGYLPARRATLIEPVEALRAE
jgi:predicted permease